MKNKVVSVTEFKAKCLALLEEVNENRETLTITKRGRPLAMVHPVKKQPRRPPLIGCLRGLVDLPDELFFEDRSQDWDCVRDPERVLNPEGRS